MVSVNTINTSFYSDTEISSLPGWKSFPRSHLFQLSGFCLCSTSLLIYLSLQTSEAAPHCSGEFGQHRMLLDETAHGLSSARLKQRDCKWWHRPADWVRVQAYLRQQLSHRGQLRGLQCSCSVILCLFNFTALILFFALHREKDIVALLKIIP